MYGEPWADRLGRLLRAYGVSQAKLASVIGLSAPMMSQLISGQRVKISNPAVYGRIVALEELLATPAMTSGDPGRRAQLLADVAASHPSLTTRSSTSTVSPPGDVAPPATDDRRTAVAVLARTAGPAELRRVAEAAGHAGAPELAGLLHAAADLRG